MVSTWQLPAAVVVCALVAPAVAQPNESESAAVLQEVRLLRYAIESLARAGVGAHISSQRLHIHEQRRISAAAEVTAATSAMEMLVANIETTARSMRSLEQQISIEQDPKQRAEHARSLEYFKELAESLEMRRVTLTSRLADAEQRSALEHAEWQALSAKLDDLERALSTRQR